jgi:Zn-dependent peptidase ImmA (M78 family)
MIPLYSGSLERAWLLAHEIAHLTLHSGPKGALFRAKNEAQANKWAACALIPEARILLYMNACMDSMIAALSSNYEDIPLMNCPSRVLASEIARYRMQALEVA